MDRRQRKTRNAIFTAFKDLLAKKRYNKITVQEIIDTADVGRTTFYAHFETKDDLLKALCAELFGHIVQNAVNCTHTHGLPANGNGHAPQSVLCHLLHHLQENDHNILGLLSCESSELFLRYFKDCLNRLLTSPFFDWPAQEHHRIPEDFLANHISGSFVDMVQWWLKGGKKQSPEQLTAYFEAVMSPIFTAQNTVKKS